MVRMIPVKGLSAFSRFIGSTLYALKVRRKIIETNLDIAFGDELKGVERRQIIKETYLNASQIMFEFLYMHFMKLDSIEEFVSINGLDVLEDALKEERGAIIAGNHFGNWELATAAVSKCGKPLHVFTGLQKNKSVDNAMNHIRRRFGTQTITKAKTAAFEMMKVLKNNQPLGMAGDLNVPHDNLFVDFFGKKAVVGQGLATFTLKKKAPLIFLWNVRQGPFKYEGYLKRINYQISGNYEEDLQQIAQLISDELEEKVRKNPGQYFWFNRRWKTRPKGENGNKIY